MLYHQHLLVYYACDEACVTDHQIFDTCLCLCISWICLFSNTHQKRNSDPVLAGGNHPFRIYYPDNGYVSVSRNKICAWYHSLSTVLIIWLAIYRIYAAWVSIMFSKKGWLIQPFVVINDKCHKDKRGIFRIFNAMTKTICCKGHISWF